MSREFLSRIYMMFLWPFRFWVKATVVPDHPMNQNVFTKDKPILYVLPTESSIDLFVLRWKCRKLGLPVPNHTAMSVRKGKRVGYLYLSKLGLFARRRNKKAPAPLYELLNYVSQNLEKDIDVQIVPVSIIWGRNPGKGEQQTIFKLLFSDDENAGSLRKFFIMLAQGRNVVMNFGKAISLKEQAQTSPKLEQTARKIRRVVRVHFYKQRVVAMGPSFYDRSFVANLIAQSKPMQAAIEAETKKKGGNRKRAIKKARRYVIEISAEPRHALIKLSEIMLKYVWQKIFKGVDIYGQQDLRDIHTTHEVVYLTCHRSHIDYLLVGYVLYTLGVTSPHTAAGINLNFWPVGRFIRGVGGFFIRRSFGGNRMYSTAFNEYVHYLLTKGFVVNFFPEGGRSRTGRTLPAKTGLLSMVVHSHLRDSTKPVALVPVYVGYDNVVEVASYQKELRGKTKKKESIGQFLGAVKIFFRKNFGEAYVNFAKPILIDEELRKGSWDGTPLAHDQKPKWFSESVNQIAHETMARINKSAVVNPVALTATALLSTPQKAMTEGDLDRFYDASLILLNVLSKYYGNTIITESDRSVIRDKALDLSPIQRFKYPGDDVFFLNEFDAVTLSYYKNNIIHLFVIPAIIANQFIHNDALPRDRIVQSAVHLYPFVDKDFYIGLSQDVFSKVVEEMLDTLIEAKLLAVGTSGQIERPAVTTESFATLRHIGNALGSLFERYGIGVSLLAQSVGEEVDLTGFEGECVKLSQRISLLNGQHDASSFDRNTFRGFVDTLRSLKYLKHSDTSGKVRIEPQMNEMFESLSRFLSSDVIHAVQRSNVLKNEVNEDGQD